MKKYDLIVFTSGPGAYAPQRIKIEMELLKKSFTIIAYKDIDIVFKNGNFDLKYKNGEMPLAKGIFLRGLGEDSVYNPLKVAIVDWYKKNGSKVINYKSFKTWPSLDKITQHISFADSNIPIVESFFFGCREDLENWAKESYPFIAKDVVGSCGRNVFKIENKTQLDELMNLGYASNIKIKTLLFQRFLKAGEDVRIIVLGGRVLGGMKRIAKSGKYLTNYSQGGDVEAYDIKKDKKAKNIALKVANTFKLDYCGVDLMRDNGGNWIVLEVNRACQFEGFEKANNVNVALRIINHLL